MLWHPDFHMHGEQLPFSVLEMVNRLFQAHAGPEVSSGRSVRDPGAGMAS